MDSDEETVHFGIENFRIVIRNRRLKVLAAHTTCNLTNIPSRKCVSRKVFLPTQNQTLTEVFLTKEQTETETEKKLFRTHDTDNNWR